MSNLCVGFARVNITPMLGIGLAGYYKVRKADGVLDELEINALAIQCKEERVVILSVDHLGITRDINLEHRKSISEATGLPSDAIYIHATHTHTAPYLIKDSEDILEQEYYQMVSRKVVDAAVMALADLKPAKMGWGIGHAPDISFIRRYRMKDGSIQTNPGICNPDIEAPIGHIDDSVNVVRFDREGAETLVLVNFANHPDTVGGCTISADWPGFTRRTVERLLDNTKCIFVNGAQGDVNHIKVFPKDGDLNDMSKGFDDIYRGYGHARYLGRVVAGGVLQAFDKVKYVEVDAVKYKQCTIRVPSNMPNPEDMVEAYRIDGLHQADRDDELPYTGMMLTTIVAEAARMIRLEHGPEAFDMELSAISIGEIAFLGIPGEPFSGVGHALKETQGFGLIIPSCTTNGKQGYFPMKEAYDEGGYEARSSNFRAGVAELIIEEGKKLLAQVR